MTIQIETSKGRIMAVKVFDNNKQEIAVDIFPLIENRYQIIGKWSHLTEEQAAMIVDLLTSKNPIKLYRNYKYDVPQPVSITFCTAIESFASLMHADGERNSIMQCLMRMCNELL